MRADMHGFRLGWCLAMLPAAWLLQAPPAAAANWNIEPRLRATEDFSDNIGLDDDAGKRSDMVTTVTPGVRVTGTGSRLVLSADYQVGKRYYQKSNTPGGLDHRLVGTARSELVQDALFLDGRASYTQQNIDQLGAANRDNVNNGGNRQDVYTYALTPTFRHHFGGYADTEVSYSHEHLKTDTTSSSTDIDTARFRVGSGRYFSNLSWSLDYSSQDNRTDRRGDTSLDALTAQVAYNFTRQYGAWVSLGRDKNDFPNRNQGSIDGNRWLAGLTWTPSPRTRLKIGAGRRYDQPVQSLDFSHRARRLLFGANYSVQHTTSQAILLNDIFLQGRQVWEMLGVTGFAQPVDGDGNPVPGTLPIAVPGPVSDPGFAYIPLDSPEAEPLYDAARIWVLQPEITDEIIESKRFAGSVRYTGKTTTGLFSIFQNKRQYQLTQREEDVLGFNFNIRRRLSPLSSASLFGDWQQADYTTQRREDEIWSLGVSANKRLSEYLSLDAQIRHNVRDSSTAANSSTENRATIALSLKL